MNYLSLEDAKAFLLSTGFCLPQSNEPLPPGCSPGFPLSEPVIADNVPLTLPNDSLLAAWLNVIEIKLNEFLGFYVGVKEYKFRRRATGTGELFLPYWPLVSPPEVKLLRLTRIDEPLRIEKPPVPGWWDGGQKVLGLYPRQKYEVTYKAGYDPIPDDIQTAMKFLLMKAVEDYGIDFLSGVSKEVMSASLGGLSQSYQFIGQPEGDWVQTIAKRVRRHRNIVY